MQIDDSRGYIDPSRFDFQGGLGSRPSSGGFPGRENRFDAQLRDTQTALQQRTPFTAAGSRVNQSAQALVGDIRAIDADRSIPYALRRTLTDQATRLADAHPGGRTQMTAAEIARTLNQFRAALPFADPATGQTLRQAGADARQLYRAAGSRGGLPDSGNDVTPQVQALIDETSARQPDAVSTALGKLEGNLLSLAANTGNGDTSPDVHRRLQGLVDSVRNVVEGDTPAEQASETIGSTLERFIDTLRRDQGDIHGAGGSLRALVGNLGELDEAASDQVVPNSSRLLA